METLSLGGKWTVRTATDGRAIPAHVPGDIYHDLLNAREIPDPFYRDNEKQLQWIGETDWTYSRSFSVPARLLKRNRVLLRCEGLDTLATIRLNGRQLGLADNMFRVWEWDAKPLLRAGRNDIEIHFRSTLPYIAKRQRERPLPCWLAENAAPHGWIRKEACNYGWDWGIKAVTCGIWRNIALIGYDAARLGGVLITQDHSAKGRVDVTVEVEAEAVSAGPFSARVAVGMDNQGIARATAPLTRGKGRAELAIPNTQLWWPNNLGKHPLYDVSIELLDANGAVLDTAAKRIGLRTLRLDRHKDKWGESFQFVVNGVPFFAKGANWIPADGILARMTPERYRRLVQDAAAANMNMLRAWGGGIYEDDAFYDACDELGICVYQDFMFACSTYPTFDKAYMKNVEAEARDNIRRLRHHPCIALWCGNNELEQGLVADEWTDHAMSWEDYGKLFDKLLPELVQELDPQRDYWPCSPHNPAGDRKRFNNPACGDAHLYDVWNGGKPFETYRTYEHRFASEFGFQSFPEPKTVHGFTAAEDRNLTSRVMEHHQRNTLGTTKIMQYMLDWLRLPLGFDNMLWASQILQGIGMKYACEHWRRSMPRGMGTLYWQFNDTWPVASWSCIDYYGRWKALHHMARNFFAPVLISGLEDARKGTVEMHVTSDLQHAGQGSARWIVTDLKGKTLLRGGKKITTPVNANRKIETLRLKSLLERHGPENVLVWLEMAVKGQPAQKNLVLFARPKHLELERRPGIGVDVRNNPNGTCNVTLNAKHPALWVWLELAGADATLSDNFFHLRPGKPKIVILEPDRPMSAAMLREQLIVRSLVDTY